MKKKTKPKKKTKVIKTVTTVTTTTTTTTVTGKLKNRIGIIIDSSGSMASMHGEVVTAFNGQVDVIQKNNKDMDTQVSLVTFADAVTPNFLDAEVAALKKIEHGDFRPAGSTALYDAIGYMISHFEKMPEAQEPNCSFLLVIVTDGDENSSKTWNYHSVREKIQALEKTNRWTFTYLGASEGLKHVGVSLGMSAGNTISGGILRAQGVFTNTASNSMGSYFKARAGGQSAVKSFYQDPNDAVATPNDDSHLTQTTGTTPTVPKTKKEGTS